MKKKIQFLKALVFTSLLFPTMDGFGQCLTTFPYLESFETDYGAWFQNTDDGMDWTTNSGGTSSIYSGPSAAQEGSIYAYIEASDNFNKTAMLTSACFDIASLSNPVLNFKYHMYGVGMGSLEVEISTDDGSTWASVWSKSGDQGNAWRDASINLSSYKFDSPLLRLKGVVGNDFRSDMAIDALQIREVIAETDIVTFALAEQTGAATIDAVNHRVAIEVVGGLDRTSLAPTFTLSEGARAHVNGTAQISGATANDFSSPVIYTLTAEDGTTLQYWIVIVTEAACLSSFPSFEGFETDFGAWFQNTDDGMDWTRRSGRTGTSHTGPSAAEEGSIYAYINSFSNFNKTAMLTSACLDIASLSKPVLNFKYHMYGATMGSLEVEISTDDGSTWASVWSKSGDQGDVWKDASINLSSYKLGSLLLRFKGVAGNSYKSDMAIDAVRIRDAIAETDIVTFSFAEQTGAATIDAANHRVAIEVVGGLDRTSLAPTFTLSEGARAHVNGTAQISGTTANDFSSAVTYTITAEDGTALEYWIVVVTEAACLNAFPSFEGFETDLGAWFQNTDDGMDWTTNSGRTSSRETGPSAAQEGNIYAYIRSIDNSNKTAMLTSACLDIASLSNPALNFKYHMYGEDMGSLEVEIATDDLPWTSVWSKSGDQGNAWKEASINLSPYAADSPRLRFKGVVGNDFTSDMAIDAVQIREGISETDIVAFSFAEQTGTATIDAANHRIAIEVLGGTDVANLAPIFALSEGARARVNGTLQISGITANDFSNAVTYALTAEDGISLQDWKVVVIEAACLNAFPYFESFETDLGAWFQNTDDGMDWTRRSGGTLSPSTGPSAAYDETFYAYIEASNNFNKTKTAMLTSACLDIASLSKPVLNFKYHMYGVGMGSLEVEIATDDLPWTSVWSKSGDQGDVWKEASIDLSPYPSDSPRLRFKGVTGSGFRSDMAIDAIAISEGSALSTQDIIFSEALRIYPNPAPNKIHIATAYPLDAIKIYGINGKLLQEFTPQKIEDTYEIAITNFSSGIYFIEMMSGNKKAVKRFVKK
jgi:hypothetical protein